MANLGNTIVNGILRVNGEIIGNVATATKLKTARTINGVAFDGTKNITIYDSTKLPSNGNAVSASKLQTARNINGVAFDGTKNITIYDNTKLPSNGNAVSASKLQTARNINGVAFDGTVDINTPIKSSDRRNSLKPKDFQSGALSFYFGTTGGLNGNTSDSKYMDIIGLNSYGDASGGEVNALAFRKTNAGATEAFLYAGTYGSSTWSGKREFAFKDSSITGNAGSATKLQTARTINGVSFDGTKNITIYDSTKLPSGGNAVSASKLQTARKINGVSFDGTGDITIYDSTKLPSGGNAVSASKLQTARAFKIGNTSKNFDGQSNLTWTINEIGAPLIYSGSGAPSNSLGKDGDLYVIV